MYWDLETGRKNLEKNIVDNQKCQARFRPLCNKILIQPSPCRTGLALLSQVKYQQIEKHALEQLILTIANRRKKSSQSLCLSVSFIGMLTFLWYAQQSESQKSLPPCITLSYCPSMPPWSVPSKPSKADTLVRFAALASDAKAAPASQSVLY